MMDRVCVRWTIVTAMAVLFIASGARATTWNSPTVDGVPPLPAAEGGPTADRDPSWASDELLFEDPLGDSAWGPFNDLQGVWVTWDAEGIYFSVQGAVWDAASGVGANSVNLYIDVDYGRGTGYGDLATIDAEALSAITRNFWRPLVVEGGFGVDWGFTSWAGRFDLGFLDVRDPENPLNLFQGANGQTSNTHTSEEGVIEARDITTNSGYELFVPWNVFYPEAAAGRVPSGTQIALVVAQVGGGDSLSPESIPDGADDRLIERPLVFTVDGDGDGVPDQNWPPNGTIAGTVTLADPTDTTSVLVVQAFPAGSDVAVGRAETPPGGGEYTIDRLQPGPYRVEITQGRAPNGDPLAFCVPPQTVTVVEDEVATADFTATLAESGVTFSVGFANGPEATTATSNLNVRVTRVSDGAPFLSRSFVPSADPSVELRLCDDTYLVEVVASLPAAGADSLRTGYVDFSTTVQVSGTDFVDLGAIELSLVEPTRLAFTDARTENGGEIEVVRIPKSEPELDSFVRGTIEVVAIDDEGREAWLTEEFRTAVEVSVRSIDPRFPTQGSFGFWSIVDTTLVATSEQTPTLGALAPTIEGRTRARFLLSGDTREVARLRASHSSSSIATGSLEVAITAQLPSGLDFAMASTQIVAGDSTTVSATVLDVLGEPIRQAGLEVEFRVTPSSSGARVAPNPVASNGQGEVGALGNVVFTSTRADTFTVEATIDNGIELVVSDPIEVVVLPAPQQRLEVRPQITGLDTIAIDVQVVDAFGNPVELAASRTAQLEVGPDVLVADAPTTITLGRDGAGRVAIDVVPDLPGVLVIAVRDDELPEPLTQIDFELTAGLAGIDEAAPESNEPNSLAEVDLTTFSAQIRTGANGDELVITVPFSSSFGGMHIGIALEVTGNESGATTDPFAFPITFAHDLLPDFALTYKYSANDYGDFRRWSGSAWEWRDWVNQSWVSSFADGVNIVAQGLVSKEPDQVVFRLPAIPVLGTGFRPGVDTIRAQVYLMQEEGDKRKPFDSIPDDQTLDMVIGDTVLWNAFGPSDDPGAQERLTQYLTGQDGTGNTELDAYVEFSPRRIGNSLTQPALTFLPDQVTQGDQVRISLEPAFLPGEEPASPIFQVFADLSPLGGDRAVRMNDEGREGDQTAGDGVYSTSYPVPLTQFAGNYDIVARVLELTTAQEVFTTGTLPVTGEPELVAVMTLEDAVGDDHGPNQPGVDFLFYESPTNGVFFDGVFDLRRLEVFDVGDRLLFRISIGDLTDPNETSAADWGATYPSDNTCPEGQRTDLNLQNVVILLDSKEGVNVGSIEIPENRWADIAPQDAWEYAMVFDGWWKGMIRSNGTSNAGGWNVLASDEAFYFCASATSNTIDGYVDKDVFEPEELERILTWDVIVMLSSHDGDSNENNWGGVRWVNDNVSEWNFGGGRNGEDGRERDPNIIDLMTMSGLTRVGADSRKPEGRTQEQQLDYLTPEARARFAREERVAAVQLEATEFRDLVPPTVDVVGARATRAVVPKAVLQDGPVVVRAEIQDDSGVENARMFWWAPGESPAARREVTMGRLRGDLDPTAIEWAGDIPWTEVAAATASGPLDDPENVADRVRYVYVAIEAADIAGNSTVPTTGTETERFADPVVVELPVEAVTEIRYPDLLAGDDPVVVIDLNEGSRWTVRREVLEAVLPDSTATVDLVLRTIPIGVIDEAFRSPDNPTVLGPDNRFLGIARRLDLEVNDGGTIRSVEELPSESQLSFHFPRYLQREEHPGELTLFRYEDRTDRWILAAGHGEADGSTITIRTQRLGSFAGFTTPVEIDTERYVTGLVITPNPFTPNGDGLYDEVDISYVLPERTDWAVVEIYDIRGERVRVLQKFEPDGVTNRTLSRKWDGRDEEGRLVPMGLYVVRVEVRSTSESRVERATKAVAVVR